MLFRSMRAQRQGSSARKKVVEWLFLYGVDVQGSHPVVGMRYQAPCCILTYPAQTGLIFCHQAAVGAEQAAYRILLLFPP